MALAGALNLEPDEHSLVAVVIFPDNIFKYASSVCRHFPELCPQPPAVRAGANGTTSAAIAAPSRNDQLMDEMMENLKNPYDSVAVADLVRELDGNSAGAGAAASKPLVIDVRPSEQFASMHIAGAVNLPQAELSQRKAELPADRNTPIVMVCGVGKFSKTTTLFAKSLGYRNVRSLKGGINEWVRKGQPAESAVPAK
jgi:rhodanese-related sulfurtransferase